MLTPEKESSIRSWASVDSGDRSFHLSDMRAVLAELDSTRDRLEKERQAAAMAIHDLQDESLAYQRGLEKSKHVVLRFPEGTVETSPGVFTPNQDVARELLEKMRDGAILAMPTARDGDGHYLWALEYVGPDGAMAEAVARLMEADPHGPGDRKACQTCRSIGGVLGRPFGCEKK